MDREVCCTLTVGDKPVKFHKLTRRDWAALADKCYAEKRTQVVPDLQAMMKLGLVQGQLALVVQEFSRRPTEPEIWRWVNTPTGMTEAAALSSGVDVEDVNGWPVSLDLAEVVAEACGLRPSSGGDGKAPLSNPSTATTET